MKLKPSAVQPPDQYRGLRPGDRVDLDGVPMVCDSLILNEDHDCPRGRACKAKWNAILRPDRKEAAR